ncbi:MAG: roadblock/LC7 domain-containing protein [Promethearchaeota archaeon]
MIYPSDHKKFNGLLTELIECLKRLVQGNSDIEGATIVSPEGLPIASTLSNEIDDALLGAMMAAVQSFAERSVQQLARGTLKQVLIEAKDGNMLLSKAENNTILCILTKPEPSLGMVLLNTKSACKEISSKYSRVVTTEEMENAYRKILLIMKENNTTILELKRDRLPEFFLPNLLTNDENGEICFKLEVDLYFKGNNINLLYDKKQVSIHKI